MNRLIVVCRFIILVICTLSPSWGQVREHAPRTDKIMHSIGIDKEFYPQPLFQKFRSKYYYISKHEKISWYAAVHKCHSIGGHLISLTDNESLKEVSELVRQNEYRDFWIDLNDLGQKGDYVSISSGLRPSFVNWCDSEISSIKNNSFKSCVNIENTDTSIPCMKSVSCIDFRSYICESHIPRTISIVIW